MIYGKDIKWRVEPVAHNQAKLLCAFSCGKENIDNYIHHIIEKNDSTSFVIINNETEEIIGIYALSCSGIMVDSGRINLVPAVELKLFALNEAYQHIPYSEDESDGKLSDAIFSHIYIVICDFVDNQCGAQHIVLYSVPEAVSFYKRNGLSSFDGFMRPNGGMEYEGCTPMFMEI